MKEELSFPLREPFASADQQREAVTLGMWIFLATEMLFFGGLFVIYSAYRIWYPHDFAAGSRHLDLVLGTLNTGILLLSSFFMAGAVGAARLGERRTAIALLLLTTVLGTAFLGIKAFEWHDAAQSGFWPGLHLFQSSDQPHGVKLFFSLYYVMTGLHGFHMLVGLGLIFGTVLGWLHRATFAPNLNQVMLLGLYWHFIDIVWIFLFPLLYLIGRSS